ncbi:MAG: type secretory pathway, component PulD [Verrucomicrobia bacterium]|nr:type secretory pathway, component PulD [Verrucomicrobiota bacterium]
MRFLILFFAAFVSVFGAPALLDRPIDALRFEKAPLVAALRTLGRATQTTILVAPDVTGEATLEIANGTLRDALSALTEPSGFYFMEENGAIHVRRLRTILYTLEYPQLNRTGSGSASITLGGANGGTGTSGYGTNPSLPSALGTTNGSASTPGSDATQVSISQDNPSNFWATIEAELKQMLKDGDTLVLNRFSGIAQVTAPASRHEIVRSFIALVNHRITQQVEIEARLVEVTLRDEQKLGVDWDLATGGLGGNWSGASKANLDVAQVGGGVLSANTFSANLGVGRVNAVIQALNQQGSVTTVAQPRLRALNNQSAFIKVGQDRPFFRLQQSTTFNQPGTTNPYNQTQEQFTVSTITIGTILAVTPQIDANGVVTLDVLPAITRLQAIITSPDGRQTAPVTEVKQASTIVRLRDGETAVIGGLISEESGEALRSIPILGAVPVLGRAFQSKGTIKARTELVIFLTPRLIRN